MENLLFSEPVGVDASDENFGTRQIAGDYLVIDS